MLDFHGGWAELTYGDDLDLVQSQQLRNLFTFKIKDFMNPKAEPEVVEAFEDDGETFKMPQMAYADPAVRNILGHQRMGSLSLDNYKTIGMRQREIPKEFCEVNEEVLSGFRSRADQLHLIDSLMEHKHVVDGLGGILQAPPGTGKTVMGAEIVARMGYRAVILVHKEFLLRQWLKAFEMVAPKLKVCVVAGNKTKFNDAHVCIAMAQKVVSEKFQERAKPEFWTNWGVVMADETHRYGARKWQQCLTTFSAPYRFGLTATPRRKDGTTKLFKYHIGPVLVVGEGALLTPKVKRVYYTGAYKIPQWMKEFDGVAWKVKMTKFDNLLVKRHDRNAIILEQIMAAWGAGRKILVLTSRREHGEMIKAQVEKAVSLRTVDPPNVYLYFGAMKKAEYLEAEEKGDVIVGTYQMAQEGLDIPKLDVLVMATPRGDVEQPVGRILRDHPFKPDPVVVDVIDTSVKECVSMFNNTRRRIYQRLGCVVGKIEA